MLFFVILRVRIFALSHGDIDEKCDFHEKGEKVKKMEIDSSANIITGTAGLDT